MDVKEYRERAAGQDADEIALRPNRPAGYVSPP